MLLGLFLGIAVMIILVMKTKTHTFIALLLAALITGLIGRMSPTDAINAIQDGFGNTLKSTGIIIGLGVMMGGILEKTGAAERLAYTFIKSIGKGKEEWALGITGWLVSIPVFADSAIVIFAPLNVIKVSGIGDVLGAAVVALPIPAILIPLIIGALMRIALGSATVAITTAASLTAPLAATLGINPILLAQSSCIGAIAFSYFNDSGFWVFNGMFGLSELKDQVRCKTAVSLVMTGVGIVELLILSMIF